MNQVTTTEVTMTIKEIAELTGKSKSTVENWIKKILNGETTLINGETTLSIREKISSASPAYPARFNEEEVITIIRAGGNETLANLLQDNSKNQNAVVMASSSNDLLENVIKSLPQVIAHAIASELDRRLPHTQNNLIAAPVRAEKKTPKRIPKDSKECAYITVREGHTEKCERGLSDKVEYRLIKSIKLKCDNQFHRIHYIPAENIIYTRFPRYLVEEEIDQQLTIYGGCMDDSIRRFPL